MILNITISLLFTTITIIATIGFVILFKYGHLISSNFIIFDTTSH